MHAKLPRVVILGQPNAGKSTLFNRLIRKRKSIEYRVPGITRDYVMEDVEWEGCAFTLIDTGGLMAQDHFEADVTQQIHTLIKTARLIIFLVDGLVGITPIDLHLADLLRKSQKPVFLVVNKIDTHDKESLSYVFYELGMGDPLYVSSAHGRGITYLQEKICAFLSNEPVAPVAKTTEEDPIHVAIIGRPNVGKSTLLNALLGENRTIVSEHAGTTRDAIDAVHHYKNQCYIFTDTAGLRHKAKVENDVEYYSGQRTLDSLSKADIALLMLDATSTITEQDQRIAGMIEEQGCGCVIVLNKWDLIPKNDHTYYIFEEEILERLKFFRFTPVVFISAKTHQRVSTLYDHIQTVFHNLKQTLPTPALNTCIHDAMEKRRPPAYKGQRLKVLYAVHTGNRPFLITVFVNHTHLIHFSYKRYLLNALRAQFKLEGVPLRLLFKN